MHESRESRYLADVLALDPQDDAARMLQLRRDFANPSDIVMAEVSDSEGLDLRTRMQQRLGDVRQRFWSLPADELSRELELIRRIGSPETSVAAARLQEVARLRDEFLQLRVRNWSDDRFVDILMQIVIAPPAEANRLREREFRWMRPPVDAGRYESARRAIQGTTSMLKGTYPDVFALEETWLTEILEYNPVEEQKNESLDSLLGCGVLLAIPAVIFAIYKIVTWMF